MVVRLKFVSSLLWIRAFRSQSDSLLRKKGVLTRLACFRWPFMFPPLALEA